MAKVDISVVIINFNTAVLVAECVQSIKAHTKHVNYEVIVVDNNSDIEDYKSLLTKLKQFKAFVHIIRSNKNKGFAGGNNLGIKKSSGKYILLLNSDTKINSNVLSGIVEWMDKEPKVGISTCSLLNRDGSVQGSGGYFPTLTRVFAWMLFLDDIPLVDRLIKPFHPVHHKSFFYKAEGLFNKYREQDWVTGAFFLIRKNVIDDIGLLDENYFMYVEDVDYCFRAKKAGWKIVFNPAWSIVHYGGASSTKEFPIVSEFRGLKQYYQKHYPHNENIILSIILKVGSLLRIAVFGILEGKEAADSYAKAFRAA